MMVCIVLPSILYSCRWSMASEKVAKVAVYTEASQKSKVMLFLNWVIAQCSYPVNSWWQQCGYSDQDQYLMTTEWLFVPWRVPDDYSLDVLTECPPPPPVSRVWMFVLWKITHSYRGKFLMTTVWIFLPSFCSRQRQAERITSRIWTRCRATLFSSISWTVRENNTTR